MLECTIIFIVHCRSKVTHYFTVTPLNIISAWQTLPSILFIISSQKVLRLLLWTNREWNNSLRPTGACSNSCNHRQVCFYGLHSTAWRKVLGVNRPVSWGLSVWRWWCSCVTGSWILKWMAVRAMWWAGGQCRTGYVVKIMVAYKINIDQE